MLSVIYAECHMLASFAECRYAECHYAECHNAECRYAERRGASFPLTDRRICLNISGELGVR
jgi:hypothetical protein